MESFLFLLNPVIHYHLHKFLPPGLIMRQLNLVHTLIPYFRKITFNTMCTCTPRSFRMPLPLSFGTKMLYAFQHSVMDATYRAHVVLLELICLVKLEE
jgi:hypothetical protein